MLRILLGPGADYETLGTEEMPSELQAARFQRTAAKWNRADIGVKISL
jgi:hypothetical protein